MRRLDTLSANPDRLRMGPWRGDHTVALLSPVPGVTPTRSALNRSLDELTGQGYRAVLTPALTPLEQAPFLAHGFVVHERLHLLRHPLRALPISRHPRVRFRRGRERDVDAVLDVDRAAFDAFWRFDRGGLADARAATPTHRFRVAVDDRTVVGYHVTGRAGGLGYLQRLAVSPSHDGAGIGTGLVGDALGWCRRRGCTSVLVNTQEANGRALRLYEHLGFRPEPHGLAVLEHRLDPAAAESTG
ncbi:MAG: GNAT family N-acetyltransferase [Acidimicrobiales bacterium]|jgi:GNAT superfamily N-acetyltransferase|nr:GNAT family N-acetyltransferase [Acidimicrobiales bacterium]